MRFFQDVTEHNQNDEALRESEERHRRLFDLSSDALLVLEPASGRLLHANPSAINLFRAQSEADLIARSWQAYSPIQQPDGKPSLDQATRMIATAMIQGTHLFEWQHRRLNGDEFPATVSLTRLDLAGQPVLQAAIHDITAIKKQEQELILSRTKLRELIAHREQVREDERACIARELHDDLGQYLTALRMEINLLEMRFAQGDDELMQRVRGMRELVDHVIGEMRTVISRLRPAALDLGLIAAAEWLMADYRKHTGIACDLIVMDAEELKLSDDQATTVFRILQESLTNVVRHAQATHVEIRINTSGGFLFIEVRDNGQGFDPAAVRHKKTFGLMGIRERALIYGGSALIDTGLGQGTVLSITLPINCGEADDSNRDRR